MKTKWILLLIPLLVGAIWYFGYNRTQEIKDHQQGVDSLQALILVRGEVIWEAMTSRQVYLDSVYVLNSLNKELAIDYENLKKRLTQTIVVAKDIPPDTAYQILQDIYPDAAEKPYGFSIKQIKSIYIDVLSVPYLDSMIVSLKERTLLYSAEITLYRDVIREDSILIDDFVAQGVNYREVVSLKNQQIASRDKKLRSYKLAGVAIGAGAFILGVLVGK